MRSMSATAIQYPGDDPLRRIRQPFGGFLDILADPFLAFALVPLQLLLDPDSSFFQKSLVHRPAIDSCLAFIGQDGRLGGLDGLCCALLRFPERFRCKPLLGEDFLQDFQSHTHRL